jgi:hypothetical protein
VDVPIELVAESRRPARDWTPAFAPDASDVQMSGIVAGRLGRQAFSCPWTEDTTFGDPLAVCKGEAVGLVALRNPWSHGEWSGAWSDGDGEAWSREVQDHVGHVVDGDDEDGL